MAKRTYNYHGYLIRIVDGIFIGPGIINSCTGTVMDLASLFYDAWVDERFIGLDPV